MVKSSSFIGIVMGYNNEVITSTSTKFFGKVIENPLSWKAHTDQIIPEFAQLIIKLEQLNHLFLKIL
jgi:hypothetical protein